MHKITYLTVKQSQTKKLGKNLAKKVLRDCSIKKAEVLGLVGDLGGGKTTFLQGFARKLGIKQRITSPTFIIYKRFKIPRSRSSSLRGKQDLRFKYFYHIDCYRIQKIREILALGFKEIITNPRNIVAIEWADRIKKIMPKDTCWIKFEFVDKNSRQIDIKYKG